MTTKSVTLINAAYNTSSLSHSIPFGHSPTKATMKNMPHIIWSGQNLLKTIREGHFSLVMYTPVLWKTYIFKNSMTSGDKGEAPDTIRRTRPPSFSFILLKTNLSHIGDGFLPKINKRWMLGVSCLLNDTAVDRHIYNRRGILE